VTEEVRRALLAYIGRGADPRFSRHYVVANVHQQTGCSETEVWEHSWDLLVKVSSTSTQQVSSRTTGAGACQPTGGTSLRAAAGSPEIPMVISRGSRREIPDLDDLVALYITEALRSSMGVATSRPRSCWVLPRNVPS